MRIFLVYALALIGTSIIDAFWNLVVSSHQGTFISRLLLVSAIMFIVLYKTKGRPKTKEAVLMGTVSGILAISIQAFESRLILEFLLGPIFGALSGLFIAYLSKKFL